MTCNNCGVEYAAEVQECPRCGQRLEPGAAMPDGDIIFSAEEPSLPHFDPGATLSVSGAGSIRSRLRPRSIWQIFGEAFRLYRQHWKLFCLVTLLCFAPLALVHLGYLQSLNDLGGSDSGDGISTFGWFLIDLAVNGAAFFLSVFVISRAVSDSYLGKPVSLGEVLLPNHRFWGFLGGGILGAAAVFATFMIVYLAGVLLSEGVYHAVVGSQGASNLPLYVMLMLLSLLGSVLASLATGAWLAPAWPAAAVEGKGALRSIRRGVSLVEGFFGKAVGILALALFGDTLIQNAVTAPYTVRVILFTIASRFSCGCPKPDPIPTETLVLGIVLGLAATALALPLLIIPIVLFYYDLRIRKEAFDLQALAQEIDPASTGPAIAAPPQIGRKKGSRWLLVYAALLVATGIGDGVSLTLSSIHHRQAHGGYKWPEKPEVADHIERGIEAGKKGDNLEARSEFMEAIRMDPQDARAHYYLGQYMVNRGLNDKAAREFREAARLQKGYGWPLFYLGLMQDELNEHDDAIESWRQTIAAQPEIVQTYFYLGDSLYNRHQLQGALNSFQDGLRYLPASQPLKDRISAAQAAIAQRDADERSQREAARLHPEGMEAMNLTASDLYDAGDADNALLAWRKAAAKYSNDAIAHRELGWMLYEHYCFDEAQAQLEEAVRLDPKDFHARSRLGFIYKETGQLVLAMRQYEECAKLKPDESNPPQKLQEIRSSLQETEGEMAGAQQKVQANPNDAASHYTISDDAVALDRFDLATHEAAEASRLYPGNADYHSRLGYLLWKTGHPDEAIPEFREAIRLGRDKDSLALAHCDLGHALHDKKQETEARAEWQTTLTLQDDGPPASEARQALGGVDG